MGREYDHSTRRPRHTFVASPRGATDQLSRTGNFEFEDVVCEMESADLLAPASDGHSTFMRKARNKISDRTSLYSIMPRGTTTRLDNRSYDIGFFLFQFVPDLVRFDLLSGWRRRTHLAVCVIEELWARDIPRFRHKLSQLKAFDLVFCCCYHSIEPLAEAIGREVLYLPPAVDVLRFMPTAQAQNRAIDVCSIGRRSPITHRALIKQTIDNGLFYHFDSVRGPMYARNPRDHRLLLANLVKHSQYFIANVAKIDQTHETDAQPEIGQRFFEGMAGGAVLLGQPPKTAIFDQLFDWPDAVIEIPFDCPGIAEVLAELNAQPARLRRIRQDNLAGTARRHDWMHRWQTILETAGLPPTPAMRERARTLSEVANRGAAVNGETTATATPAAREEWMGQDFGG
ncbi:Glycosyl transferases group 1 [Limimonas halophila]|uniref:Glycosyl transferases group 1 n=1 Tax=Limimonas halophila TaxID=1082479 RepID=A0A1G7Q716_9PROT|nr:glycosyltransferase [Limimonas halophila]SDF94255.1 Glycosyl transferases group 1 [Limimonas halophila]